MLFAVIWVILWGWLFDITDSPSVAQIIGFIVIGIIPPVWRLFLKSK